jgi:broad specificity phosphatase PhoE
VSVRRWVFLTHPNVIIDPAVPVPRWSLSEQGRSRMRAGQRQPWVRSLTAVHCSTEQKAIDGAAILAAHLGLMYSAHDGLGENDRSATGFLPPPEFERVADAFFARPDVSVRGWERALDAQRRIVAAVQAIGRSDTTPGTLAIVSHGAVGALLQCWLADDPISRQRDQPANGGGNWFAFTLEPRALLSPWQAIDGAAVPQAQ